MRARDLDLQDGTGAEYGLSRGVVGIGPGRVRRRQGRFIDSPQCRAASSCGRAIVQGVITSAGSWVTCARDRSPAARAAGIVYVRDTTWLARALEEAEVPPAVAQTFARGGPNFQRTHDAEAERMTSEMWVRGRSDRRLRARSDRAPRARSGY